MGALSRAHSQFQSTPSAWRVTASMALYSAEEGFQSTPSAWRVTSEWQISIVVHLGISIHTLRMEGDVPQQRLGPVHQISIHTLRMEGDHRHRLFQHIIQVFQSTPSAWRVTEAPALLRCHRHISIHTLRMEGDSKFA